MSDAAGARAVLQIDPRGTSWALVPHTADAARRAEWPEEILSALAARWGVTGQRAAELAPEAVVRAMIEADPGGVLAEVVDWPVPGEWPIRVSFSLAAPGGGRDLRARGYAAAPCTSAALGAGTQYTRRSPTEEVGREDALDGVVVFDRGDATLVARIHPAPLAVYLQAAPALAALLDTVRLTDAAGRDFSVSDPGAVTVANSDLWAVEDASGGADD
ncbi:hypothetical protein [Microbacterium excoecariae]|uniref:hypothetical protein n=1 Tax=Microbacterium excoecariae TaxID=2715210 RepID=UPI0014087CA3|nr:hypothetical protein [Microbacterium excoecariae]NHI16037.1 hypothetical protein [Microbacterium excoecariae]